jgi:peptidoglycan/xylan/chitin deacetylase (PgdA/CDA1 family)
MRSAELGWKQKAIAHCYFRSPLPALVRPVRDRYLLSVSRQGRWPKLSMEKRNQPSARILYYHRVNDDNDPFFPAISTALFREEMRFVSRHYRVVTLAELVDRLSGTDPEPVVAITFDDGYQDNWLNAFPILEQYGLPATIFLTTESLDNREPLWFEQLALAFKRSPREWIDLELGAPQRLWLRTETERLDANGHVFGLLRRLTDEERREWLVRILRQLAFRDEGERRDKMLTWDQVRLMQKRGIDFGGHTVTHPFLSRMTPERVQWEITECKRRIEEERQRPVAHFAYPNGREEDFGAWNKEVMRRAGYSAAVSTIWGVNYPSTDRMELRRGGPWEESAAVFAYKLDWYQLVND